MTVLNYVHHSNVAGQLDTLDKIRSFAVAQGWTQGAWVTGNRWDYITPYGFTITDSDAAYLELTGASYGSQTNIAKLQTILSPTDSVPGVHISMASATGYTLQDDQPYAQNAYTFVNNSGFTQLIAGMNIGTATYDDLWIYGDSHWIGASLSMDGVFCQHLHFGSFHMYESSPTQGVCRGHTVYNDPWLWQSYLTVLGGQAYWPYYNGEYLSSQGRSNPSFDMYWDSRSQFVSSIFIYVTYNVWPWDVANSQSDTYKYLSASGYSNPFLNLGGCLRANSFSGKRLMLRQNYWCQRQSDSVWVPVCKTPIYFLNTAGLTIGETLTYGSEEFLTFPFGPYQSPIGMAVQIA